MHKMLIFLGWLLVCSHHFPCDGGSFWHITDLHLDYEYVTGGNKSNFCHKNLNNSPVDEAVGPAGNYNCDSPYPLVMSSIEAMHKFEPKPDFIVWTGDSAPHWRDPAPPDEMYITNVTKTVFTKLDQLFPGVPIIPALGNHDSSPPDQFPIASQNEKTPEYYNKLWKFGAFGDHIGEDGRETFMSCGYYTKLINRNIRFIVLNTNIYYGDEYTSGTDPCGQLTWLENTLQKSNEAVFIVAHVPPGAFERGGKEGFKINFNRPNDHFNEINNRYVQIVSSVRYTEKISAHLYGHLHTDTFRIFLDRVTGYDPRGVAFMAGSVTPLVWALDGDEGTGILGVNPSIRLFSYEENNFKLTDYLEYNLDILSQNDADFNVSESSLVKNRRKSLHEATGRSKREEPTLLKPVPAVPVSANNTMDKNQTVDSPLKSQNDSKNSLESNTQNDSKNSLESNSTNSVEKNTTITVNNTSNAIQNISETATEDDVDKLVLQWKLLYRATEAFAVPDLTASSMFQAVQKMVTYGHNGTIFKKYYEHNTVGHKRHPCDVVCWRQHICTITKLVETELMKCLNATNGSGFYYPPVTTTTTTEHVLNDNDNLTFPPNFNPSVTDTNIEIKVVTAPPRVDKEVKVTKVEDNNYVAARAVSIFFGIVGVLVLVMIGLLGYKKYRDTRYRNQEFLLTDSVFRYDGYSQLDDD